MTIIPIVIGAFGTVTKGLLKGQEDLEVGGRVETIQTTALLRTARILRRVLVTWGDLLSLRLQWKTIGYCWCEKLKWVEIIISKQVKHGEYTIWVPLKLVETTKYWKLNHHRTQHISISLNARRQKKCRTDKKIISEWKTILASLMNKD